MTLDQAFRDPMFLKAGGAVAIYLLGGGNRTAKWAAAALAAWAAWDWYSRPRLAIDVQGRPVALAPVGAPAPGMATARPFSVIPGGAPIEPYAPRPGVGGKGAGAWQPPPGPVDSGWIRSGMQGNPSDGTDGTQ